MEIINNFLVGDCEEKLRMLPGNSIDLILHLHHMRIKEKKLMVGFIQIIMLSGFYPNQISY